jgi:hypothetical protein
MIGYGRHSETERMLVDNEELITLNRLKIQSFPLGNLGGVVFMQFKKFRKNMFKNDCIYAAKVRWR